MKDNMPKIDKDDINLLHDLQPNYPVGKPKHSGPENCEKCGMIMYYGKEDHKCSGFASPAVIEKPKSYFEQLEEEADKLSGKYVGVLYPKFMLSAYYRVHNETWSVELGGHPESFIDHHLGEWISKIPHKDLYLQILSNSVKADKNLFKMLCLRLNYALYIGKEHVSTEVKIHRNKIGFLLFNESTKVIGNEIIYDGKLNSANLKDEEIEEWARKFYSAEETISQSKSGLPEHVLYYINNMLLEYGYEINTDGNAIYKELNQLNKVLIEEGLVARVAFLTIVSSIKENKRIS
jgi:hypothetical protein